MSTRSEEYKEVVSGSEWVHRNGNKYTVVLIANKFTADPERYPETVVYKGENGKFWCRPLSDWYRSMTLEKGTPNAE